MYYSIYRNYYNGTSKLIIDGLTLQEAQDHCSDPNTSSRTCDKSTANNLPGVWFETLRDE